MTNTPSQLPAKKIRPAIKQMIEDGISPESIVFAMGGMVTPDEAELLKSLPTTRAEGKV